MASNVHAFAIRDGYPVTEGHTLVVPRRKLATWFDATPEERMALMDLVDVVKADLDARFEPDGYNIGVNIGAAAGQTVMHLHVHVIPRYQGDMPDPRGGVRHVIPWKGNYRRKPTRGLSRGGTDPFFGHIRPLFAVAEAIDVVAAFVQDAGLVLVEPMVFSALERGADVRLLTGDYLHITQERALRRLLDWRDATLAGEGEEQLPGSLQVRVVEVGTGGGWPSSFHPKSWRFDTEDAGAVFVGSSNLSEPRCSTGSSGTCGSTDTNGRTSLPRSPAPTTSCGNGVFGSTRSGSPPTRNGLTNTPDHCLPESRKPRRSNLPPNRAYTARCARGAVHARRSGSCTGSATILGHSAAGTVDGSASSRPKATCASDGLPGNVPEHGSRNSRGHR